MSRMSSTNCSLFQFDFGNSIMTNTYISELLHRIFKVSEVKVLQAVPSRVLATEDSESTDSPLIESTDMTAEPTPNDDSTLETPVEITEAAIEPAT